MSQVALVVEAMQATDRVGIDRRALFSILSQGGSNFQSFLLIKLAAFQARGALNPEP